MLLGNIIGKSGTNFFTFLVKGNAKKFMYVKALHNEGYSILAQVVEMLKRFVDVTSFKERNMVKYDVEY